MDINKMKKLLFNIFSRLYQKNYSILIEKKQYF